MVKENIDREKPTQGGEIGNIVGLSRGMRGNKRETRRKRPTQAKKTRCLVGLRRKKRSEGNRHQETTRNSKTLLTYKLSRYIICNIVTYKISRN